MAIVLQSTTENSAVSTSLTITKPASLAVGDLMVLCLAINSTSGTFTATGWTQINYDDNDGRSVGSYYKIADSSDVAASDFTFTRTGGTSSFGGSISRVTGVDTTTPLQQQAIGLDANIADGGSFSNTITPSNANSMLFVVFFRNGNPFDSDVSNIVIATSNPSWTVVSNSFGRYQAFYAVRPQTTATGTMTTNAFPGGAGSGGAILAAFNPSANAILTASTGTFTLTGVNATLSAGYTLIANTGAFILTGVDVFINTSRTLIADTGAFVLTGTNTALQAGYRLLAGIGSFILSGGSATLPRFWRNQAKNNATATNQTKNSATFRNLTK